MELLLLMELDIMRKVHDQIGVILVFLIKKSLFMKQNLDPIIMNTAISQNINQK
jgi:hypothetical protein